MHENGAHLSSFYLADGAPQQGEESLVKIKMDMLKLNWEGVAGRSCSICSTAAKYQRHHCRKTIKFK